MTACVQLAEIVDGSEWRSDECQFFLNKETGKVVVVDNEVMRAVEDGEPTYDFPDWQQEQVMAAEKIVGETGEYIDLPSKFDINEYRIMEDFCFSLNDPHLGDMLLGLIKGRGAFGRFKEAIYKHGIQEQWHGYRENTYKEVAIEWCRDNGIEFET